MTWINFLHLYQPANTDYNVIREALDKSYWRLIRLLEEHENLKLTINITACLLLRLEEGEVEFIKHIDGLLKSGKLELTGSAAYHPLLPLLPEEEIKKQIIKQEKVLRRLFGKQLKLRGFFLPEMAYSSKVAKIIKKRGYEWIILDEISYDKKRGEKISSEYYYEDKDSHLKVIFRDRTISSAYVPDNIKKLLKSSNRPNYIITANDSELYGLRHKDPQANLEKVVKFKSLKTCTISQFIDTRTKAHKKIMLRSSSWETSLYDIKNNKPFKLWLDRDNKIQINLWDLAKLALTLDKKFKKDTNYYWYRWHLNRGLASCTFWWASAHDFSKIFGPYAWNPDVIERGLEDLIRSVRSINDKSSRKDKLKAEKYYIKIKRLIWEEHWIKHW